MVTNILHIDMISEQSLDIRKRFLKHCLTINTKVIRTNQYMLRIFENYIYIIYFLYFIILFLVRIMSFHDTWVQRFRIMEPNIAIYRIAGVPVLSSRLNSTLHIR